MKDTTKAQVTTLVKGLISRSEETKQKAGTFYNQFNFNNRIQVTDWRTVVPDIYQGGNSTSFNRIGDRIKPKGLYVEGFVAINQTEARALGLSLDIYVITHKSKKSLSALAAGGGAGLVELTSYMFDGGDGNKWGYDGTTEHALMPINTDLVKLVKHKRVNLFSSYAATVHQQPNADDRRFVRVAFKVPTPNVLIYADEVDNLQPSNYCPLIAMGFHYPDGTAPSTDLTPVIGTFRSRLYFDDA